MPLSTLDEIVDELIVRGMLARSAEPRGIVLASSPERVRVVDVLEIMRDPGSSTELRRADERVERVLALHDRAVDDAIGQVTIRTLVESTASEPSVADLDAYRRRSEAG